MEGRRDIGGEGRRDIGGRQKRYRWKAEEM